MSRLTWTLAATLGLGGIGHADPSQAEPAAENISLTGTESPRNIAQNVIVAPEGGELGGSMKFIMADPSLGGQALKFTDLGMFELTGRWAVYDKLELAANVDLLAKQPSYTDEKPFQSASGSARVPLGIDSAMTLYGGGGHLIDHVGQWTREGIQLEWKKPIEREFLSFDLTAGVDEVTLGAPAAQGAYLTEAAFGAKALVHDPRGYFGGWLGIGYAIPVANSGKDPTTNMALDPQARLDFEIGAVAAVNHSWDLFADFVVIDRGDLANPATRLPILDGGFDQKQIIFGVSRHFDPPPRRSEYALE